MEYVLFFPHYLYWHYGRGFKDLLGNLKELITFIFYFFSIGFLLKTLFVPWRRLSEKRKGGFDPEDLFETIIVNVLMRLVGAVARGMVIVVGLLSAVMATLSAILISIIWAIFPLFLAFILAVGIQNILQ